jgi:hypothetical protein
MYDYSSYPAPLRKFFHKITWRYFYKKRRFGLICRYIALFGKIPNLILPRTYNEILLKKLLFDRNPQLTLIADKVKVRDFVIERLGTDSYLTRIHKVFKSVDELEAVNINDLPKQFVLKPNHGSAWCHIVYDRDVVDKKTLIADATNWMSRNYGLEFNEWAYIDIPPRLIIEELLAEKQPIDYRIVCFHGQPKIIYTRHIVDKKKYINMYDVDWNLLPVTYGFPIYPEMQRPSKLKEMLEIAAKLSRGIDLLRVDLYQIKDRIVFGELTNYSNGGQLGFNPPEWDEIFGSFYYS